MADPYLYKDSKVLKNLLNITDEKALDLAESELSIANMIMLYNNNFTNFSKNSLSEIHKILFGDVYEWAGNYRTINIQKREEILAGRSVWYSNAVDIEKDLESAWDKITSVNWENLNRETFAINMAHTFPILWQVHPFREGNTRAMVILMALFTEHYGYFFDQDLIARSAGYFRNSFVLASLAEHSEFEHLENILLDAVSNEPIKITFENTNDINVIDNEKYQKYHLKDYIPQPHEYLPDDTN